MKVKIELKDYGKGKRRIILVNEDDGNVAFASFGEKDKEWHYLYCYYEKQNNQTYPNRAYDLTNDKIK